MEDRPSRGQLDLIGWTVSFLLASVLVGFVLFCWFVFGVIGLVGMIVVAFAAVCGWAWFDRSETG